MDIMLGLVVAAIAFVAGAFAGKIIAPNARRIKELEEQIEENKQQHQTYKDNVATHFSTSANLFGDITEKYRSLYNHLSAGAYDLCDRRDIPRDLTTSHVNILAVESPEISPQLNEQNTAPSSHSAFDPAELMVDVSREGMSPIDPQSQKIIHQNKVTAQEPNDNTAEIIDLDSQRSEESQAATAQAQEQAKDYAIKAKGVINHNSLNQDDVST